MNNLYEAVQVCLHDMELGADIETSLLRYPDLADELRPILETSAQAKKLAPSAPSEAMMQRNRARLLQRAAEMRAARLDSPVRAGWFNSFRRAAVALAVLVIVFLSGTGLVRASSTSLPGDNLYPVKRTSENLTLLFTLNVQARDSLAVEYENERLEELHELITIGRSAKVDFAGIVTEQNGKEWLVAGIPVLLTPQTDLRGSSVSVGDAVRVFGITQGNGFVSAERIDQLPAGANLPDTGNSGRGSNSGSGSGNNNHGNEGTNENDSSGPGNGNDNSNDNNSGPGGNDNSNDDNSGPGGNDNSNDDNSGSGGGNENSGNTNSGPGGGNINDDNSGSENGINQENDGSGGSRDQSNENDREDNGGSGSEDDNSNQDDSESGGSGDDD